MAELAANRGVDIINMWIGGLPALNDGDNARAALYNRIIAKGVQLVISAGNSGNALNTIGDPSVATDVISVGASISDDDVEGQLRLRRSLRARDADLLLRRPARGRRLQAEHHRPRLGDLHDADLAARQPGRRGGLLAAAGLRDVQRHLDGVAADGRRHGAAAVGGQGQERRRPPARPRCAPRVYCTATYDDAHPGVPAGPRRDRRRRRLRALLKRGTVARRRSRSAHRSAPRSGSCSAGPRGTGLYNRCAAGDGGQAAGERQDLRRDASPARSGKASGSYAVSLVGNDGTFSVSPPASPCPSARPVTVKVTATRRRPVPHSALLRLDDSKTLGVDSSTMLAVVAGGDPRRRRRTPRARSGTSARRRAAALLRDGAGRHQGAAGHARRHRRPAARPASSPSTRTACRSTPRPSRPATATAAPTAACNRAKRVVRQPAARRLGARWSSRAAPRRSRARRSRLGASLLGRHGEPGRADRPDGRRGHRHGAELDRAQRLRHGHRRRRRRQPRLGRVLPPDHRGRQDARPTTVVVPEGADPARRQDRQHRPTRAPTWTSTSPARAARSRRRGR